MWCSSWCTTVLSHSESRDSGLTSTMGNNLWYPPCPFKFCNDALGFPWYYYCIRNRACQKNFFRANFSLVWIPIRLGARMPKTFFYSLRAPKGMKIQTRLKLARKKVFWHKLIRTVQMLYSPPLIRMASIAIILTIVISKLVLLTFSHLLPAHFNPTVSKLVTYQHGDSRRISDPQH